MPQAPLNEATSNRKGNAGDADPHAGRRQKLDVAKPKALQIAPSEVEPAQRPHDGAHVEARAGEERRRSIGELLRR